MSKVALRVGIVIGGLVLAGGWANEWTSRRQLERRYDESVQARQQLDVQLGQLRAERDGLAATLTAERSRVQEIAEAFSAKSQELRGIMDLLSQEERVIKELQEKLVAVQRQFDQVQGELALALQQRAADSIPLAEGMVKLEKVVVTQPGLSAMSLQGRVLSVDPDWRFVVIDLGWDAVKIGDVVSIYRNEQLLGKARIERVQEQVSAASLLPEWTEAEIQVNDVVRSL